jgi:lipoprotein-releasing system permease protein
VKISVNKGKSFFFNEDLEQVLNDKNIVQFNKVIEEHALFDYKGRKVGATIKGVDSNYLQVNSMDTAVVIGEWFNNKQRNMVVVGAGISYKLSVSVNSFLENLKIYVAKPGKGQVTMKSFKTVNTQTIGIFQLTQDLDNKFVYASLPLTQELLSYKENQISAIELKLKPNIDAITVATSLQKKLGDKYKVQTRQQLNAVFYKMLNMENLFLYLIFTLVVIIALFNVIGAIIMMILDKKEDLKTLFNLGLSIQKIKKIFALQGFLLTVFGLVIGMFLGIVFVFLQMRFGFMMLTQNLSLPMEFHFYNVLIVVATILVLGTIAALIASGRISKKLINA